MIVCLLFNGSPYLFVSVFADNDAHATHFQHKFLSCLR